jgi:pimeloyl-ACP methyl ester carboxylesterase
VDLVLDLDVPLGGRVRTTWTAPIGEARGWAWVQHGFGRRASALAGLADLLARDGIAVVRPDIAWWRPRRSMHDRTWLTAATVTLARAVEIGLPQARGVGEGAPPVWTLVGHSAGGAVAGHAAACLEARIPGSVAGLVLLDPVDTVGGLLAGDLPALDADMRDRARVHACRPSRCNRQGATVADLRARAWSVSEHPGLSHADPERIPGEMTGPALPVDPWAARLCGQPGSGAEVLALAAEVRAQVVSAYS